MVKSFILPTFLCLQKKCVKTLLGKFHHFKPEALNICKTVIFTGIEPALNGKTPWFPLTRRLSRPHNESLTRPRCILPGFWALMWNKFFRGMTLLRCHQVLWIWGDDITGLVHAEEVYRPPWKMIGPYLEDHLILVTPPSMQIHGVHGTIQASKVYNVT